ncbi:MAG: hypothetical protein JNM76_12080 [Betaproteobacteria bacterium]|nr:hypothetical protein [Betaproteobacteria bacterium]
MSYQLDGNVIRDQSLEGEMLVLDDVKCRGLVDCTFASGVLKLTSTRGKAVLLDSVVKDSEVIAVKRQRDYRLFGARFINCKFHGVYSGIDFGREGRGEPLYDFGAVEGCDFTEATLDGCRFFNTDISSLRFPRWPHVVIPEPQRLAGDIAAMEWPGHLGKYMAIVARSPMDMKAAVLHIPSLVQLLQCTEAEARDAIDRLAGVLV